jgi:membrane associated rhomboid family serine protease
VSVWLLILVIVSQLIFLLPLKDRRSRYRTVSWMTITLIAANVAIHAWVTVNVYLQPAPPGKPYWFALYPFMEVPSLILARQGLGALSVLTSGFLHASLSHLLGNMFVLWFFGRKVEDLIGPVRFGLFYLLCLFSSGLLSVVARSALSPFNAQIPALGASGAITGVMGAYLFLYPGEKVLTLISAWPGPFISLPGGCCIPLFVPLWIPAWVYIVYDLITNALLGQFAQELARQLGFSPLGVNVFAHLGGGLGGLICIYFFLPPEVMVSRRPVGPALPAESFDK